MHVSSHNIAKTDVSDWKLNSRSGHHGRISFQILNDRKKSEVSTITQLEDTTTAARKARIKKEPTSNSCNPPDTNNDQTDLKDEPGDFIETNCHWKDCGSEFGTQDELVKVRKNSIRNEFVLIVSVSLAYKQRPHPREQEIVCVPMGWMFAGGETIQGAIYARGAHAKAHRGETAQMHGTYESNLRFIYDY